MVRNYCVITQHVPIASPGDTIGTDCSIASGWACPTANGQLQVAGTRLFTGVDLPASGPEGKRA